MKPKEQKVSETKNNYEDALQRELAKRERRERVQDVHSDAVEQAIIHTERKNDIAWQKVCAKLQSQLVVLQTQVAQFVLERVRLQAEWEVVEDNYKATASTLRAEVAVTNTYALLFS
jgi:hypothetical protein